MDIICPISPTSIGEFSYLNKFACEFTKMKSVYFSRSKGETAQVLRLVIEDLAIPYGRKIRNLRTDHDGEYIGREFERCCEEFSIRHDFSAPHTPSQLAKCERDGPTTMTMTRFLLNEAKATSGLVDGDRCVCCLLDIRTPDNTIGMQTPHHRMFGKDGHLAHLVTLGVDAFVHHHQHTEMLTKKAWEGRLVGL